LTTPNRTFDDNQPDASVRQTNRENQKRKPRKKDSTPSSFDDWWAQYPRHVAKGAALKAYAAAIKNGANPVDLLQGAMRYAAERQDQDHQYTKHPTTWLNGMCWEDEPAKPHTPSPGNRRGPNAPLFDAMKWARDHE
jgi:hypothetical protein